MMKRSLTKFGKASLTFTKYGVAVGGVSFLGIYSQFPEFRTQPSLIVQGIMRSMRLGVCGVRLIKIYKNPFSKKTMEEKHRLAGQLLCQTLKKNSGTSIKIGQILGMMGMFFPEEFTDEMSSLFQKAPMSDIEVVKRKIEKKFGKSISELFIEFDENPIAAGSIAQVYKAVLRDSNKKVAIKVMHPNLRESFAFDMKLMKFFIDVGYKVDSNFNYMWLYDDSSVSLKKETDFRIEKSNIERITELMKNEKKIGFPKVIDEYSNEEILTMEFVEGYSVIDVEQMKKDKISVNSMARIMAESFAQMIFIHGFVHADPHPGNIFVTKTGKDDFKLILLDNGLYADLSEKTKNNYGAMWKGIITRDDQLLQESTTNLGVGFAHKLMTRMITHQTYEEVMGLDGVNVKTHIKGESSIEEKRKKNIQMAKLWRKEILEVLEKMNRDMLLLFKINNYIEAIDIKLGQPVNNYWYLTTYSFINYVKSHDLSWMKRIYINLQLWSVLFWLKIFEWGFISE